MLLYLPMVMKLQTIRLFVGDILTIVAPATADATHDGISWTLAGVLQ